MADPKIGVIHYNWPGYDLEGFARRASEIGYKHCEIQINDIWDGESKDGEKTAEATRELFYLRMRDDLPQARSLTERRLLIFSRLGLPVRAAGALAELAMVDRMQGLIPMSAERFSQALEVHWI